MPVKLTKSGLSPTQSLLVVIVRRPGAAISGFFRPDKVGPRLLENAIKSSSLVTVFRSSILATAIKL